MRDSGGAVTPRPRTDADREDRAGDDTEAAIAAANEASREHPCRVIAAAADRRKGRTPRRRIRVGGDAGASEVVVLHLFGELGAHADAVVTPFLPRHPRGHLVAGHRAEEPFARPAGALAGDASWTAPTASTPGGVLAQRLRSYAPGDTDIAWAQITPWRVAARGGLSTACRPAKPVRVRVAGPGPSVGLDLLAGWLAECLRVPTERLDGDLGVEIDCADGLLSPTHDGDYTLIRDPGCPGCPHPWRDRTTGACLAEELRRLDPDDLRPRPARYQAAPHDEVTPVIPIPRPPSTTMPPAWSTPPRTGSSP